VPRRLAYKLRIFFIVDFQLLQEGKANLIGSIIVLNYGGVNMINVNKLYIVNYCHPN
jgi:hypothetical protein